MNVGALFEGIGGFSLGLRRAGMRILWQVEIDPFCQRVLAQHFPEATRHGDVREVGQHNLAPVDVLTGGFPCQDVSNLGTGLGLDGERSGLWSEYARIIGELRPRYVLVENVPALLGRGMGRVLGDLAALGYDAEWDCIPARAAGAPHLRDRLWIVAYPQSERFGRWGQDVPAPRQGGSAPAEPQRLPEAGDESRVQVSAPTPYGVADGIPNRVDRTRALGNAIVPQIAEWIGRRIMSWEGAA